jgi:hypothetical protein
MQYFWCAHVLTATRRKSAMEFSTCTIMSMLKKFQILEHLALGFWNWRCSTYTSKIYVSIKISNKDIYQKTWLLGLGMRCSFST